MARIAHSKEPRFDIHQHITDQIVTAIEAGAGAFRLPWHRSAGNIMRPVNVASRKSYRGVNVLALWAAADCKGYDAGLWGTYRQWAEAGAQVRKGEKASHVVFYKELEFAPDDGEEGEATTRLFARATPVFAAEQVEGLQMPESEAPPPTVINPIEQAESFVAATKASVTHGGSRAFYRPSTDSIQLPPREAFIGTATSTAAESYYSTLLHELTHWTGIESRCDRQLGKRFGDQAYAMEELVAELGAAFLCADLGITDTPRADHAQYLANWLGVLKADKKAIFTAASKASEAAMFLAELQETEDQARARASALAPFILADRSGPWRRREVRKHPIEGAERSPRLMLLKELGAARHRLLVLGHLIRRMGNRRVLVEHRRPRI